MTNTNGPDDKDSSGKEKRPYTTLDLTADEISSGKDEGARQAAQGQKEQLRLNKPEDKPAGFSTNGNDRWIGMLTHAAAGAIGAAVTVLVALWIFGNTSDNDNVSVASSKDVAALRTTIAAAETKISALEADLKRVAQNADAAQGRQSELASLTERIAALESRPVTGTITQQAVQQSIDPITAQITELERRLNTLSSAQQERRVDNRSVAVSLAFYNLQRAAREGRPYARELKSVEENAPVSLDLAVLEPWRNQGVNSLDQLQENFDAAVKAAIDAENQPADDSIMAEAWSRAKSFIRIRRKGDVEGDDTSAILARVGHRLQNSELKAALQEAETIKGPAAEAMAPWVSELKRKLAVEDALAQIETKLLGTIGGNEAAKRDG